MQLANFPKHNLHTVYSLFHPGAYVVNVPQKGWKIAMNANAVKIEGFMHELHSFEVVEEVSDVWCVTKHPGFEPVSRNKWCTRGCQQTSIKPKEEEDTVKQDLKISTWIKVIHYNFSVTNSHEGFNMIYRYSTHSFLWKNKVQDC